jgi:hypothetical protein
VHASEVVAVIQQVPGVAACALDALHTVAAGPTALIEADAGRRPRPPAGRRRCPGKAAELLLLDATPIPLGAL